MEMLLNVFIIIINFRPNFNKGVFFFSLFVDIVTSQR